MNVKRCLISITLNLTLSSCTHYTTYIMPQIPVPDDFRSEVKTTNKKIDLSDAHITQIKDKLDKNDEKFLNALLYNYYDNLYGLKICNTKLHTTAQFIDFYNDLALKG